MSSIGGSSSWRHRRLERLSRLDVVSKPAKNRMNMVLMRSLLLKHCPFTLASSRSLTRSSLDSRLRSSKRTSKYCLSSAMVIKISGRRSAGVAGLMETRPSDQKRNLSRCSRLRPSRLVMTAPGNVRDNSLQMSISPALTARSAKARATSRASGSTRGKTCAEKACVTSPRMEVCRGGSSIASESLARQPDHPVPRACLPSRRRRSEIPRCPPRTMC